MPRYHEVNGREITIYLEVEVDDPTLLVDYPFELLLIQLAEDWGKIAEARDLKLIFVAGEHTVVPDKNLMAPGLVLLEDATPADRMLYRTFDKTKDPPNGLSFFKLQVGEGNKARSESRSTKTSYITYDSGTGYIYLQVLKAPHISHELGHILGLVDRYYEGITWYEDLAIDRTCLQIRLGNWRDSDNTDRRFPVNGTSSKNANLPRFADRVTLAMHKKAVPDDSDYKPNNNLMSSSSMTITPYQLELIGIKSNGQNKTPEAEKDLQKNKWVAILGRADPAEMGSFHVWDGGLGLMFYENNDENTEAKTYPCWSREKGRGMKQIGNSKEIVREDLIKIVMRKKYKVTILNNKKHDVSNTILDLFKRNRWCYCLRLLHDLQ